MKKLRYINKICNTLNSTTEEVTQKNWIKKKVVMMEKRV